MRTIQAHSHLDAISSTPELRTLAEALDSGEQAAVLGSAGSSTSLLAGAVAQRTGALVLLCVAHLDEADEVIDELGAVGLDATRLPALEVLPGETGVSLDLFAERIGVARRALAQELRGVLVCPIQSLMQAVPAPDRMSDLLMTLEPGDSRGPEEIVRWLAAAGYQRLDSVEEPGDFAVRGGIIDVFPPSGERGGGGAVRLDFFGDELETLTEIDLETMGSDRRLKSVELIGASLESVLNDDKTVPFLDLVTTDAVALLAETLEVTEQGRGYYERVTDARGVIGPPAVLKTLRERFRGFAEINQFARVDAAVALDAPVRPLPEFARDASEAVAELGELTRERRVLVLCQNEAEQQRLGELIDEFGGGAPIETTVAYLHRGFQWDDASGGGTALVPYHELLHRYQTRRRIRRLRGGRSADTFLEVAVGDYVV
ncbi:MAG: hypothetical protein AAFX05_11115, partial [Planctomycetota bacterium]